MTAAVIAIAIGVAGCGGGTDPSDRVAVDDAFVLRIVTHEQVTLALARLGAKRGERADIRRLAARMVVSHERTLPALQEMFTNVPPDRTAAAIGVTPSQAAEDVGPDALRSATPLDPAYVTVMARHGRGALELVQSELRHGRDPGVKAIAQRLAVTLTREQGQLSELLRKLARRSR